MRLFLVIMCWVFSTVFVWSAFATSLTDLEQSAIKAGDTMYTANYYTDLIKEVENTCGTELTAVAKWYTNSMIANLESKYAALPKYKSLQKSEVLHDRLQSKHGRLLSVSQENYCILKHMMYSTQDRLRGHNLDIFDSSGIINDFWSFDLNQFNGVDIKLEGLQYEIDQLKWYPALLWIDLDISFSGEDIVADKSAQRATLRGLSGELMELTVYEVLVELRDAWVVQDSDIEKVVWKISMEYEKSCNSFHGNYSVKKTTDGNTGNVTLETTGVPFQVNVCPNYFLLGRLHEYFKKIITHEFAHHVYHYYDTQEAVFESICRESDSVMKSTCNMDSDFVTPYAASIAQEDYAESFMHYFLEVTDFDTPILQEKKEYFDVLFGR